MSAPPRSERTASVTPVLVEVMLYVHRSRRLTSDGAQDGHLDFHTAPELWHQAPRPQLRKGTLYLKNPIIIDISSLFSLGEIELEQYISCGYLQEMTQ